MWQIRIVHWGTERFNGLLGLQQDVNELHAILLDSTGLSVFDGIVDQEGNMEILQALEPIKKHRLPGLLGTSLTEIFFLQADRPCPWYCLGCASTEENDYGRIVQKHFGPLSLRTIRLQYEYDTQRLKEVEWSRNFPFVKIYLLRMDNKRN